MMGTKKNPPHSEYKTKAGLIDRKARPPEGKLFSVNAPTYGRLGRYRIYNPRSDRFGSTPEEWAICLVMVQMREKKHTFGEIAEWLNEQNVKTKAGGPWNYWNARTVTLRAKSEIG